MGNCLNIFHPNQCIALRSCSMWSMWILWVCTSVVCSQLKKTLAFMTSNKRLWGSYKFHCAFILISVSHRMYLMDWLAKWPQKVAGQLPAKFAWRERKKMIDKYIWSITKIVILVVLCWPTIWHTSDSEEHKYGNQEICQRDPPAEEEHIHYISTSEEATWCQEDRRFNDNFFNIYSKNLKYMMGNVSSSQALLPVPECGLMMLSSE